MTRHLLPLLLAACGSSSPPSAHASAAPATPECTRVAQHLMSIGDTAKWITELRADDTLPIAGVSDLDAATEFFRIGCEQNWPPAVRRCALAQSSEAAFRRECGAEKVWWYTHR